MRFQYGKRKKFGKAVSARQHRESDAEESRTRRK